MQADPSSSEPQLDKGVDGPPAVPVGPAVSFSVPATPDALDVPVDAGDVAGGGVVSAREEKRKVCDLLYASCRLQVFVHSCSSLQVPSCVHEYLTCPCHAVMQATVCY